MNRPAHCSRDKGFCAFRPSYRTRLYSRSNGAEVHWCEYCRRKMLVRLRPVRPLTEAENAAREKELGERAKEEVLIMQRPNP